MAFRIKNTITDDDYRAMAESLRETDGTEGRHGHILNEDYTYAKILGSSELEIPMSCVGSRYSDSGEVFSSDGENYEVRIRAEYESRKNNFPVLVTVLKRRGYEGFEVATGERTIESYRDGRRYRALCISNCINISTIRKRKIDPESLKMDITSLLQITEWIINAIYGMDHVYVDIELRARFKRSGVRAGDRKNRLEGIMMQERPSISFDSIGGCDEAKAELKLLGHDLMNPESFRKWGISYPKGILLHGPPGTGKTMLARAMANLAMASLYCITVADIMSSYYGESTRYISKVFDMAQKSASSIILFDEIDSLLQKRSRAHEETVRVVSIFLQRMDGIKEMDRVTVIGTTNSVADMDGALLRPGRFDKIIEVAPPDRSSREVIYMLQCKDRKVCGDADYELLAERSDGFTGADIAETVQMSLAKKLKEELITGNGDLIPVSTDDILQSITEYRKRKESRLLGAQPEENRQMYA